MKRFMKQFVVIPALVIITAVGVSAQTSNSVPFTAVTAPPAPAITSLSGLSPTGKIYAGTKMPVIGTGFSASCVVNVDGVAQPAATFVFVSATEIDFTIPASLGSASGVLHNLTVSCPQPVLAMNATSPNTLPNGKAGVAYSANLVTMSNLTGGVSPYKCSLLSGSLPTGFNLSSSCIVTGTPSGAGSFNFSYLISDSSGLAHIIHVRDGKPSLTVAMEFLIASR